MKKTFFILIFIVFAALLFESCATPPKLENESKVGVTVKYDDDSEDGGSVFCIFDGDWDPTKLFSQETTCGFQVQKGDFIFQCDKIKLSSFGKDFKLEENCSVIMDLRKNETDTGTPTADVNNQCNQPEEKTEEETFRLYSHNQTTTDNPTDQPQNYFMVMSAINLRFC